MPPDVQMNNAREYPRTQKTRSQECLQEAAKFQEREEEEEPMGLSPTLNVIVQLPAEKEEEVE